MDPNQVPTTPPVVPTEPLAPQPQVTPMEPVVSVPPTVPVEPPIIQPIAPEPIAAAPFMPQSPQSVASSEVFGSSPQPVTSVVAAYPEKKSNKKLFIIIAAIIVGLGVLGTAVWLVWGLISAGSITLKEYSNDQYSLLVPEKYTQDVQSTIATFTEPDAKSDSQSQIQVSRVVSTIVGDRAPYIDEIDKTLTESKLNDNISSGRSLTKFNLVKSTKDGNDIRTITADAVENGATVATVRYLVVIGQKSIYILIVAAHISDPGLAANAEKITDSFKIK